MRRLTVFLLSMLLIAFMSQCDKKDSKRKSIDPEFASYIAAYTSGVISKESTIRVILVEGLKDSLRNRDHINKSLFEKYL